MSERFSGSRRLNEEAAIQQDLLDAGIEHVGDWREAAAIEEEGRETQANKLEGKENVINKKDWQAQVDIAFEKRDYNLIATYRDVVPDIAPSDKLVKERLNELVTLRPTDWTTEIFRIERFSSLGADATLVKNEFSKMFGLLWEKKINIQSFTDLSKATGYSAGPDLAKAAYQSILSENLSSLESIQAFYKSVDEITGTAPNAAILSELAASAGLNIAFSIATVFKKTLPKEKILRCYEEDFARTKHLDIDLIELTGVPPPADLVQRAYEQEFLETKKLDLKLIKRMGVVPHDDLVQRAYQSMVIFPNDYNEKQISDLWKATAIKPAFTSAQLRPIFEKRLVSKEYKGLELLSSVTGIKPDTDLVKARALKIIDSDKDRRDGGKEIINEIAQLSIGSGVEFEISDSELQERYEKAIAEKNVLVIRNLFEAFSIKPTLDREASRAFFVSLMDTHHWNDFPELEKVFGLTFTPTEKEIEDKQNEDLEKFEFYSLENLRNYSGKPVAQEKIDTTFSRWLMHEATTRLDARPEYSWKWEKKFKEERQRYSAVITPETVLDVYAAIAESETLYSGNLKKIHELTGVEIPPDTVQKMYARLLSPDYAYEIPLGSGSRTLGDAADALSELIAISGVQPVIPAETLQSFYLRELIHGSMYQIKDISEMTGVKPDFSTAKINDVYKQLILSGQPGKVTKIKDETKVKLLLDEETALFVSQQIESGIAKLCSSSYESEEEKGSLRLGILARDLNAVKAWLSATGSKPDAEKLQTAYAELLVTDPWGIMKIEEISDITKIKPQLDAGQVQAKGEQLLEQGALHNLQTLVTYGPVVFNQEAVKKAYDDLLAGWIDGDKLSDQYRRTDWLSRLTLLKSLTGISPTEGQVNKALSQLLDDKKYYNSINEAVDRSIAQLKESFGIVINSSLAVTIYSALFPSESSRTIEEYVEKLGIAPVIPEEVLRPTCDRLVQRLAFTELSEKRRILGLAVLPLSPEVIQGEYRKLLDVEELYYHPSKQLAQLGSLYEATGVRPELSAEEIFMVYQRLLGSNQAGCKQFEEVIGQPPSQANWQAKADRLLADNHIDYAGNADPFKKIIETQGIVVSEDMVARALEAHWARVLERPDDAGHFCDIMTAVTELTGVKAKLSTEKFYSSLAAYLEKQTFREKKSHDDIKRLLDWFEEYSGTQLAIPLNEVAATRDQGRPDSQLNEYFRKELLVGNISGITEIEKRTGARFEIPRAEIQALYTRLILEVPIEQLEAPYQLLLSRTGIVPNITIIQARYRKLFSNTIDAEAISRFQEVVGVMPTLEQKLEPLINGSIPSEELISYRNLWNEDRGIVPYLHLLKLATAKEVVAAFSIPEEEIPDGPTRIALHLPNWDEIEILRIDSEIVEKILERPRSEWGSMFLGYHREHTTVWEIKSWDAALVTAAGSVEEANRYLLACSSSLSMHDALYFIPGLLENFQGHESSLASILQSVRTPDDSRRLAEYASSFSLDAFYDLEMAFPATIPDFIKACILIRKNFRFPQGVSDQVREKINVILESVNATSTLSDDLAAPDGPLIRLLENRDGLDEKAYIQPVPELSVRISPLGAVLKEALGTQSLSKMAGTIGQLQKVFGARLFELQKKAIDAEESSLKRSYSDVYARPGDDVELINLKKTHARHLDGLKILKGGNFAVVDDKGDSVKKISSLVERLPAYREADSAQKISLKFEMIEPLYQVLAEALAKDKIGNNFATDPVLSQLASDVGDEEAAAISQKVTESDIEFKERASQYMESALDRYLALVSRVQKLKDAQNLYKQTEILISRKNPELGKEAMREFLKDPEKFFTDDHELEVAVENLLERAGIRIGNKLIARVLAKSDSRGIVCGDDTNCCMPYGSEKNYEYMYRTDTAYFTISLKGEGFEETIAQSVLVAADLNKREEAGDFKTLAFDNIEVGHAHTKLVPEIAKLYRRVIGEYWPEKTIIMGTNYNDDRELVRSMGELVRNRFTPIEGDLYYSDCFSHDTVIKLRDPVGEQKRSLAPRVGFLTPEMLAQGGAFRDQITANFLLSPEEGDVMHKALAPAERVLYRDDDNDPVFEADNKSVQVSVGDKPVLLIIALDYERLKGESWDEIGVTMLKTAPQADNKDIQDSLISFLSLQPATGYKVSIPQDFLNKLGIDVKRLAEKAGYKEFVVSDGKITFIGEPESDDEDDYEYDDDE